MRAKVHASKKKKKCFEGEALPTPGQHRSFSSKFTYPPYSYAP